MNIWLKFSIFCVISLVVLGGTACGGEAQKEDDPTALKMSKSGKKRARNGNLVRVQPGQSHDINEDGEVDQWTYSQAGEKRLERDLNFDGIVDMWQYRDASGNVLEEEMDLDLDGSVDLVVYYKEGVIIRKELSTDFSGLFTVVKYYDGKGELLRVERDEDADGDIDIWEYYEKNERVRVGWDNNDDGSPDEFDAVN